MNYNEPFHTISVEDFVEQFVEAERDYLLLDVREPGEYSQVRIPGAVNIPLSTFQLRFQEVQRDQTIVVVCAHGGRSAMAAEFMAVNGYQNLYNLVDGTMGWWQRGLQVESD
jgi:rhodanese-related sulfurtransferase